MEQLKVDILNDAYSKIRISGLTVTPTPPDLELSLNRLESMMSEEMPTERPGTTTTTEESDS